jgi:CRP/FNR family transcriptional regulator, cyclic AMP receptor protein
MRGSTRELVAKAFSESNLLQALEQRDVDELARGAAVRTYRPGQIVFSEGEPADVLAVLLEGRLKVSTHSYNGAELIMTHVIPGESFGELGVLSSGNRSATITAVEDSVVAVVSGSVMLALVTCRPAVALAMLRQLADTVRRITDVASDLVFLNLEQRVAKFLLERIPDEPSAELELTQTEIASYVGASRQRVNACLRTFTQRGWITLRRGRVTIIEQEALQRSSVATPQTAELISLHAGVTA